MTVTQESLRGYELTDRYMAEHGRVFLTGVQALVRGLVDQRRADRAASLRTAGFVSGYPGSPLAGLDVELARQRALLRELNIVHQPGVNEDTAATSVWGSQNVASLPGPRQEGVIGAWYAKAPGFDRAGDAIRHANYGGTHPLGGVVAMLGDDPTSKSSSVPSSVEQTLAAFLIPTFTPGSIQEVLDYTLHAIACSRASGAWSALKVSTIVADGGATVVLDPERVRPETPVVELDGKPYVHVPRSDLTVAVTLEMERTLFEARLPLAAAYATLNGVNRVTESTHDDWLGVVAAGKTYHEVVQAFDDLGIDAGRREQLGIRLMQLGMVFPLDDTLLRSFARGLQDVLVVEDKLPFVETRVRDALYGMPDAPRVLGKRDERHEPLLPATGELTGDRIAPAIARLVSVRAELPSIAERLTQIERLPSTNAAPTGQVRTPFFCSGCPHNSSTAVPGDTAVAAGIGCHAMVLLAPSGKGNVVGLTQMGGEGAQWVGMAPFTDTTHFLQNVGDGTFHHSASLALRAATNAGVNITYKLLYNDAIAMTGGQNLPGRMTVEQLTHWLAQEGVKRVIVTTEDRERYRNATLHPIASLRDRAQLLDAQRELADIAGVTVLIHDQRCAAETRRLRRRGVLPTPAIRVRINEKVCEGCGDCGAKSNCMSVQPIETPYGRKTQIHDPSCNSDYSCLAGDCPSFLTVVADPTYQRTPPEPPGDLPEPSVCVPHDDFIVRMPGIGGTGVVTISQILGVAALLDNRHVASLDQTGLSQKGGPVVSDVRISTQPIDGSNHARIAGVDLLLGFDLLGAATPANLMMCDTKRTVAVISSSAVPTASMVVDVQAPPISTRPALEAIERATREDMQFHVDAQLISELLFQDNIPANMLLLGAAFQHGAIPLQSEAIERAIELNGAGAARNLMAFRWGRAVALDPDAVQRTVTPTALAAAPPRAALPLLADLHGDDPLDILVRERTADLVSYQDARLAERYLDLVGRVQRWEREHNLISESATEAVARYFYKLLAYKDEYEVARLHLDAAEESQLVHEFGPGARVSWNLHPPLLRAMGLDRKIRLGPWFKPALQLLQRGKRLRGTRFDPFGYAHVRKVERALIDEYESSVRQALAIATPDRHDELTHICALPDTVRGYEEIKLASVERYRAELVIALEALREREPVSKS
jgi:indolepyruvate ferredoxin oxidoreductase